MQPMKLYLHMMFSTCQVKNQLGLEWSQVLDNWCRSIIMYACPLLINLTCLNKAPSVTAVFSSEKCLWFWCTAYSNTFKLSNLKLNIIRCTSCRMLAVGTDVNDMCFERRKRIYIYPLSLWPTPFQFLNKAIEPQFELSIL